MTISIEKKKRAINSKIIRKTYYTSTFIIVVYGRLIHRLRIIIKVIRGEAIDSDFYFEYFSIPIINNSLKSLIINNSLKSLIINTLVNGFRGYAIKNKMFRFLVLKCFNN